MKVLTGFKRRTGTNIPAGATVPFTFDLNSSYLYPDYSIKVFFANPGTNPVDLNVGLIFGSEYFSLLSGITVPAQDSVSIFLPRNVHGLIVANTGTENIQMIVSCMTYDASHFLEDLLIGGRWYSSSITSGTWDIPKEIAPGVPTYFLNPNPTDVTINLVNSDFSYLLTIPANSVKVWGTQPNTWPSLGYDLAAFDKIETTDKIYILYSTLG